MNTIKFITQTIIATIRSGSSLALPRVRMYLALSVVAIVCGALIYMIHLSSAQFARDYEVYAFLAKTQQNDAFIPGAPNNPVREQLNRILSDVLTKKMSAAERLALVKGGQASLDEADAQIDQITISTEAADTAIAKMQVDTLRAFSISQTARELIALAKKRSATISDIRAYSYRADFEIRQIFDRIIADDGRLSDAYIKELNAAIPEMESQFDKRSGLYNELQKIGEEIDQKSKEIGFF